MSTRSTDFLSSLYAERANVIAAQGLLSRRLVALDAVLAVYEHHEPRPQPAQTVPDMHPVQTSAAEPEAVESSASHPVANVGEEANGATAAASADPASREADDADRQQLAASGFSGDAGEASPSPAPHPETPAQQPGSEAVSDAGTVSSGEASRPDVSPVPPKRRASRGEMIETTNRRNEVAALHASEPWLAPEEAAARLLMPMGNLRTFTQELGISWSADRPPDGTAAAAAEPPRTLTDRVRLMHAAHPTWTARMIANDLGAPLSSVSALLSIARKASEVRP